MTNPIHCRVDVAGFGTPPRRASVEARADPQGFAVWFQDEHRCPSGEELARCNRSYDARTFAGIIVDARVNERLHSSRNSVPATAWRAATVTGERGARAQLLRVAVIRGWGHTDWLMAQSAASLDFLDGIIGDAPGDGCERPFERILGYAWELGIDDRDLLDLMQRHGLPARGASLPLLEDMLRRKAYRQREERAAERAARIAPFRAEIDKIAAKFDDYSGRAPSTRHRITWFLEEYVIEHGRMPRGEVVVEYKERGWQIWMGTWNFDELVGPET